VTDGQQITPQDVVWSFDKLIELNPSQKFYYQHVTKVEVTGEREVTFTFDQKATASCPTSSGSCWCFRNIGGRPRTRTGGSAISAAARSSRRWARAHTASSRSSPARPWSTDAMTTTGPRTSQSVSARITSTRCAMRFFATTPSSSRFQGRHLRLARREFSQALGDAVRFSGRAERLRRQGGVGELLSR